MGRYKVPRSLDIKKFEVIVAPGKSLFHLDIEPQNSGETSAKFIFKFNEKYVEANGRLLGSWERRNLHVELQSEGIVELY